MCGIIGIFGKDVTIGLLRRHLRMIMHRGGRAFETAVVQGAGLGANRLPIVDRDEGRQPFTNEEGTVHAVLNGEIYNHEKLRRELEGKGHRFRTKCDTEVIPHLYEEYGLSFAEHIDSEMFSIILYDTLRRRWVVARDPLGVKPLYQAKDASGRYFFASEVKQLSILRAPISEVAPGTVLSNEGTIPYFSLPQKVALGYDRKKALTRLRELFDSAVRKRLPGDLPLGILLSGGVDSAAVLATARRYKKDITAFIAGTDDSRDRAVAVRYCEEHAISFEVVELSDPTADDIRELVRICETSEANTIRHSYVALALSRRANELGFRVMLCGEGADELFAGYNEFTRLNAAEIEDGSRLMTAHLHRTQLPRVDRTSMAATIELRAPFLDTELVRFALSLPGQSKVRHKRGTLFTKVILREALADRLPDWIAWREKLPFATGAGLPVGDKEDERESVFMLAAASAGKSEQELVDEAFEECGYGTLELSKAVNKDNLLFLLSMRSRLKRMFALEEKSAVVRSFETEAVLDAATQAVLCGKPLRLVFFWGAGPKEHIAEDDRELAKKLEDFSLSLSNVLLHEVELSVLLSDEHGFLNGWQPRKVGGYLAEVQRLL